MPALILGILGFACYLIYDINSYTLQNRLLGQGFTLGSILIAVSTIWQLSDAWTQGAFGGFPDVILLILAAAAFLALIYCLFFALPFEKLIYPRKTGGGSPIPVLMPCAGIRAFCVFLLCICFLGLRRCLIQCSPAVCCFRHLTRPMPRFRTALHFPEAFAITRTIVSVFPSSSQPKKASVLQERPGRGCTERRKKSEIPGKTSCLLQGRNLGGILWIPDAELG